MTCFCNAYTTIPILGYFPDICVIHQIVISMDHNLCISFAQGMQPFQNFTGIIAGILCISATEFTKQVYIHILITFEFNGFLHIINFNRCYLVKDTVS